MFLLVGMFDIFNGYSFFIGCDSFFLEGVFRDIDFVSLFFFVCRLVIIFIFYWFCGVLLCMRIIFLIVIVFLFNVFF